MRIPELVLAMAILIGSAMRLQAQPVITKQPLDQSVSLGANVTFQVTAGPTPLSYQWTRDDAAIEGATNRVLTLTNVSPTMAGDFAVVVRNTAGAATSKAARLEVDSTFRKVTSGKIVNDGGYSFGCAWGDYDSDGFIDLIVCNMPNDAASRHHFLYHNAGNGTFDRITVGPLVNEGLWATGAAWGDYDNDGLPDLLVVGAGDGSTYGVNRLYHNDGKGAFTKAKSGSMVTQPLYSHEGIWADFDRDGLLDALVVSFRPLGSTSPAPSNYVYKNRGDGTFDSLSLGLKTLGNGDSWNVAAADWNNDGWTDVFIPQGGTQTAQNGLLYANDGSGRLILLTNSQPYAVKDLGVACSWGDYDNDGFLDLFVSNFYEKNNSLWHNNGNGSFSLVTNSVVTSDGGTSVGCAWSDYDNDGWLDLFVANLGTVNANSLEAIAPENNFLYHNNGDGTFTKIFSGSVVNDLGYSTGCAWADYNNDGFPDLFVSNGWAALSQNNCLYEGQPNLNNWLTIHLRGTASNRSAIGTKVRIRATIRGKTFWQMRELSGGGNYGSQNDMRATLGLGDASEVELLLVEWPSGTRQEFHDVKARRFISITEPAQWLAERGAAGPSIELKGGRNLRYSIETSSNLRDWSLANYSDITITNYNGITKISDVNSTNGTGVFFRAHLLDYATQTGHTRTFE